MSKQILYYDIKELYNKEILDNYKLLGDMLSKFIQRNSEALSQRLPTKRIIFTNEDRLMLFKYFSIVEEDIEIIIKKCNLIKKEWQLLSSSYNILLTVMTYIYYLEEKENPKLFKDIKYKPYYITTLLLSFRFYTSIHYKMFQYLPDESVMDRTVNDLNDKYLIRKFNTIFEFIKYFGDSHVDNMIEQGILKIPTDKNIIFYLNNLNNRINSALKNITSEYMKNYKEKDKKSTTIVTIENEDEEGNSYINDIKNISADIENASRKIYITFLNNGECDYQLVKVAATKTMTSVNKMSAIINKIHEDKSNKIIYELIRNDISYYLSSTKKDISSIRSSFFIKHMLNSYNISNTNNIYILNIKKYLDEIMNTYAAIFLKTMKKSTYINSRSCVYFYMVLYISKYIE